VGSTDASWPSKARHPVLNLRTFFSLGFLCASRPRGVRVPVLQQLVRTPRASRRVAASPKYDLSSEYVHIFSRPPSTTTHVTKVLQSRMGQRRPGGGRMGDTQYKQYQERSRITRIRLVHSFRPPGEGRDERRSLKSLSTLFQPPSTQ